MRKRLYGGAIGALDSFNRYISSPFVVTLDDGADIEVIAKNTAFERYPKGRYSDHFWLYVEATPSQISETQYNFKQ